MSTAGVQNGGGLRFCSVLVAKQVRVLSMLIMAVVKVGEIIKLMTKVIKKITARMIMII